MTVQRGAGIALWRQVQLDLENEIAREVARPGDRLPTEAVLSARYGVNRHTVRRALAAMESRGLIRIEQGRGTFVQEPVLAYRISVRTRFTETLARQNRLAARDMIDSGIVPASGEAAHALGVAPDTPLIQIVAVGDSDGQRISQSDHLFPADRFAGLIEAFTATGSITKALARLGLGDYLRKWTRVHARMPTSREATLLNQVRTRPVLVTESLNVDDAGTPIEFGTTRFNSDWVQIVFEP